MLTLQSTTVVYPFQPARKRFHKPSTDRTNNQQRHYLIVDLFVNGTTASLTDYANITGVHFVDFIPQLPALVIDSYSISPTSANNSAQAKGLDLVVGDGYRYQYRATDASGANLAFSSLQSFTATAHNMSLPYFSYNTPNASGGYCVHIDLYQRLGQLIGDRAVSPPKTMTAMVFPTNWTTAPGRHPARWWTSTVVPSRRRTRTATATTTTSTRSPTTARSGQTWTATVMATTPTMTTRMPSQATAASGPMLTAIR